MNEKQEEKGRRREWVTEETEKVNEETNGVNDEDRKRKKEIEKENNNTKRFWKYRIERL